MSQFIESEFDILQFRHTLPNLRPKRIYVPKADRFFHVIFATERPWEYLRTTNLYTRAARGGSFLEVGARIGSDTVIASDFFKTCVGFEPGSFNAAVHRRNMELNQVANVRLYTAAVSDQCGTCRLFLGSIDNTGMNSLRQNTPNMNQYEEVRQVTLDSMLPELGDEFTFIHIDTEGHDIKVLQGARHFIASQKQRPVLRIEFCPLTLALHGSSAHELLNLVGDLAYKQILTENTETFAPLSGSVVINLFDLWRETLCWIDLLFIP
ncbi:MAG: FkbM family methyltransferase [Tepidisphaeraceae bacterium]|jgi:FkbM family methyltransferase